MKRKHIATFENYQSGKIEIPGDYWKSDTTGVSKNSHKEMSSEPEKFRDDIAEKFGEERTERILAFLEEFFDGLKETTHPEHPDTIFFYKEADGKKSGWMEQDTKNGKLWCRWPDFWSFFENKIGLSYSETQYVVKTAVEHHLKREVGTPRSPVTNFLPSGGTPS